MGYSDYVIIRPLRHAPHTLCCSFTTQRTPPPRSRASAAINAAPDPCAERRSHPLPRLPTRAARCGVAVSPGNPVLAPRLHVCGHNTNPRAMRVLLAAGAAAVASALAPVLVDKPRFVVEPLTNGAWGVGCCTAGHV